VRRFVLVLCLGIALKSFAESNRYSVTLNADATRAHVDAEVMLPSVSLAMFNSQPAPGLKNGPADLIDALKVTGVDGHEIAVKSLGEGDYELASAGRVRVSYDVRLEHEKYEWPFGSEEVSYRTNEGLMITGFALFLAPGDTSPEDYVVRFHLPRGWKATTPWAEAGENSFRVPTRRELLNNALFFGTATTTSLMRGGVELTLLLGDCCKAQRPLFTELLERQLDSYAVAFGGKPRGERYLLIINAGTSGDGGAFASSFSQFIRGTADRENRVIWGHVMSHELLHFWNGLSMVPADTKEEWFKEGVTDYLTLATMARNGLVDEAVVRNRLENYARRVVMARVFQRLTLTPREAGAQKESARLLIYAGGSLAALALDVEVRKATNDAKGLPDVMRAMFREFGTGKPYGFEDVVRVASAVAGRDLRPLLTRAVDSTEFDIDPYLTAIGLRRDYFYEEQFVTASKTATAGEKARYGAMFGH
jgi:predicted metalloprotease with PDZ domain